MSTLNIIGVALSGDTAHRVKLLLNTVSRYDYRLSLICDPQITDKKLTNSNLILLGDWNLSKYLNRNYKYELNAQRSRVVIDLRNSTAYELWNAERKAAMPLLVIGSPAADVEAQAHLRRLLYTDPFYDVASKIIGRTFPEAQASLLLEIIRRADRDTPTAIAQEMFLSCRTLRRRCHQLHLRPPRFLHSAGRVLMGVHWMNRTGGGLRGAARISGYSETSAFRRASRQCFGISPSQLVKDWNNSTVLEEHLRGAMLRD